MSMKVSPINNYNSHTSYGAGEYRSGKGVQKNLGEIQKRLQYGVGPSKTFKLSKGAEKTAARAFLVAAALLLVGLFSHANNVGKKESRKAELLEKYAQKAEDTLTRDDINGNVIGCTYDISDINEKGKRETNVSLKYNRPNGAVEPPTYVSKDVAKDICKGLPLKYNFTHFNNNNYYYLTKSGNVTRSYNPEKEQLYLENIEKKVAKDIENMYKYYEKE